MVEVLRPALALALALTASVVGAKPLPSRDAACLARNVYYEAKADDPVGQLAVAQVTLNRVRLGTWGNTVCKVVYAKGQFSWTSRKKLAKPKGTKWEQSQAIATKALKGAKVRGLEKAHSFHSGKKPLWKGRLKLVKKAGGHFFYS